MTTETVTDKIARTRAQAVGFPDDHAWGWGAQPAALDTRHVVDDNARELAIYHALKAVAAVAAAL